MGNHDVSAVEVLSRVLPEPRQLIIVPTARYPVPAWVMGYDPQRKSVTYARTYSDQRSLPEIPFVGYKLMDPGGEDTMTIWTQTGYRVFFSCVFRAGAHDETTEVLAASRAQARNFVLIALGRSLVPNTAASIQVAAAKTKIAQASGHSWDPKLIQVNVLDMPR